MNEKTAILVMTAVIQTTASNASLISCFQMVTTALFALFLLRECIGRNLWLAVVLGFVTYGLRLNFYMLAMRVIGAAKTNVVYSLSPFMGVILGMIILHEEPTLQLLVGFLIMFVATYFMIRDTGFSDVEAETDG